MFIPMISLNARALYPCTIKADGNCLPSCGSVFGYGSDTNSAEIRVRIVTELVLNDDYYLDNKSLLKPLAVRKTGRISDFKTFSK
jgi:hypothetical protein